QVGSQPTSAEQEVNKVRAAAPVNA
ncbi:MAG: hypothetical protein QOE72_4158, partial [Chloroflexota bacterium]|nr:hypothetical protein [Chloroflexota bacterium]MEA2618375.1 hypothetical protein [Chloroflexota bacterium]